MANSYVPNANGLPAGARMPIEQRRLASRMT
jgi:hypothetical protein